MKIADKEECVWILDEQIKEVNSRIKAGEELMEDCKKQMKVLLAKRKWFKEYREAIEQENLQKIERMKIMLIEMPD